MTIYKTHLSKTRGLIAAALLSLFLVAPLSFAEEIKQIDADTIKTWLQEGKQFKILDVRSVAEYIFVGHPDSAYNVPLAFWNWETGFSDNPNFLDDVKLRFKPDETIVVICRSGGRSAQASAMLQEVGFKSVFNFAEGFEGPEGDTGLRNVSGWKVSGLPYSYKVTEEQKYSPVEEEGPKDPVPIR